MQCFRLNLPNPTFTIELSDLQHGGFYARRNYKLHGRERTSANLTNTVSLMLWPINGMSRRAPLNKWLPMRTMLRSPYIEYISIESQEFARDHRIEPSRYCEMITPDLT